MPATLQSVPATCRPSEVAIRRSAPRLMKLEAARIATAIATVVVAR